MCHSLSTAESGLNATKFRSHKFIHFFLGDLEKGHLRLSNFLLVVFYHAGLFFFFEERRDNLWVGKSINSTQKRQVGHLKRGIRITEN